MTIEAIIFDIDGLLVDSEPTWDQARVRLAEKVGKTWNQQDHLKVMGVSSFEWSQYMIERLGLSMTNQEVQTEIIQQMVAIYKKEIPFRPFAVKAVRWAAQKYAVALASGSPSQLIEIVTQSPGLEGYLNIVVSADEVGAGKPDPAVYLETARRLNIAPEKCVCVEDSAFGVLAGHRANMHVINIPDAKFPLSPEQSEYADLVLGSLRELNDEAISKLNSK
jgi:HAD superfamily hydrolase (TIGR01509 family)